MQTRKNVQEAADIFAAGDRVTHPKFGEGRVISFNGSVIEVEFESGRKKLAAGIAPIKKI